MNRSHSMDWLSSPNQSVDILSPRTANDALKKKSKTVARLKEELRAETNEKEEIEEKLREYKNEIVVLEKKINKKNFENEELKNDLKFLQEKLEEAEFMIESNNRSGEIALLKAENASIKKMNRDLEDTNECLTQNIKKLENKNNSLLVRVDEITNKLNILAEEHARNLNVIDELHEERKQLKIELSEVKEDNSTLREEQMYIAECKTQHNFSIENGDSLQREMEFQSMKEKLDTMSCSMQIIEEKQALLITNSESLKHEKMDLEKKNSLLQEQCNFFSEKIDNLTTKNEEYLNQLSGLGKELENTVNCLQKSTHDKFLLEETIEKLEHSLKCIGDELKSRTNSYEIAEKLAKELEIKLVANAQRLEVYGQENLTLKKNIERLTEDNCVYAVSLADANKRNFELSDENNNLKKMMKTQENEINDEKNKIESLETKLKENDSMYKNMVNEFQHLQNKYNDLNEVYDNCVKLLDDNKCENEKLKLSNQKLEIQLNICNKNYEILEQEKTDLISSNENLKQLNIEYNETITSLSADKNKLMENLHQFEITHANLNTNYEKLQNEKIIIYKNNCQLKESLDELNNKLAALNNEIKNKEAMLNDNYAVLLAEKLDIVKTLTELNEKHVNLSLELTKKDQMFSSKNNEHELLLLKYQKLDADHQLLIERNSASLKEINEMKNTILVLENDKKSLENKSREINDAFQQLQTDLYSCFQYSNNLMNKFNWESVHFTSGNVSEIWETLFDKISEGCSSLINQIHQLTEDNVYSTNKLMAIEKELKSYIEKYELLLVDKSQLESKNKCITDELESQTKKLNEYSLQYESTIQEHDKKVKNFEFNLSLSKSELQKTEIKLHDTERTKLELENTIRSQKEEYECLQIIHQSKCQELEHFIEQFSDIKEQLSINTVEFNSLQDLLNKVKSERDECLEMMKITNEESDTLKSEFKKCNDTLEEYRVKLQLAEEQRLITESTLQDLKKECDRLHDLYGSKCEEFKKLYDCNDKLEAERDKYLAKQKELNEEFLSLQTQYETLNSTLTETSTKLESILNEKISLENVHKSQTVELESCVQKLTELDEKHSAKCLELEEIRTLYNTVMSEREKLHLKIAESQSATESKLKHLESVAHNTKLENTRLKEEKESCISRNRDLSERISEVENELALLQSHHQTLGNDFTDKSDRLERHIVLCDKLKKEIADRETKLQICNKERESLISKIDKFEEELPKAMKEMEERHEECMLLKSEEQNRNALIEKLQNEIKKDEENRILLTEKLARLEGEHRMCVENQKQLLNETCAFKETNVSLLCDIQEFQKKYEVINSQYLQLKKEVSELNELRDMHVYQIDQLLSKNDSLQLENEKLTFYNDEKIRFLREVEQRFRMFDEKTREDNTEKGSAESASSSDNLDFNVIIDLLESKAKESTDLLQEKEEYYNQVQSLKHIAEKNEQECVYLKETIREKTNELEKVRTNSQNLSEDIVNINRQKEVLETKVTELTSMVHELNEKIESKHREIEKAHLDLCQKNVELKQTHAELTEKESETTSLSEKGSKLQQELDTLTNRLHEVEEQNQKNRERAEDLCQQNEELFKVEKINSETFGSRIETITSRNKKLSDEIESKDMKLVALMTENDNMKGTIEKLQNENSAIELTKNANEKLILENAQLNETLKQKQEQIQTLNKKLVQECDKVEMIKRNHSNQLQKQITLNKNLEENLKSDEKDMINTTNEKQISELQSKLEKLHEMNSKLSNDLKINSNDIKSLVNENQILIRKINDLETSKKNMNMEKDNLLKERDNLVQIKDQLTLENSQNIEKYNIFYNEYLKIVNNQDELGKDFKETLMKENKSLSSKHDELLQLNEQLSEQLFGKNQQIEQLSLKLEELECETKSLLESEGKKQLNVANIISSGAENELGDCNLKLQEQLEKCTLKISGLEQELNKHKNSEQELAKKLFEKITKKTKEEYEGKLERAKAEYKKIMTSKYAEREREWEKKEHSYKNALKKAEEHTKDLDNQIWDQNDRLLRIQQSEDCRFSDIHINNVCSPNTLRKARSATQLNLAGLKNGNQLSDFDRRASTRSLIPSNSNRCSTFIDHNTVRLSAMSLTAFECRSNSDFPFIAPSSTTDNDRRTSNISEDFHPQLKRKGPTSGKRFSFSSAKVFPLPAEDEEQEIFDNACLSDLKQGKCVPDAESENNRISILQNRNSLVPPHLKSSYPVETQTLPPQEYKENEIKMGHMESTASSESDNLINDKNKKSRSQTSYKRPGPPTPSKHGGRTTQALTPSGNVLKESNENTAAGGSVRRRSFTPKFINNLFATRGQINVRQAQQQGDENAMLTPKSNRLSSIRRRFNRNTQQPPADTNPNISKFY